MGRDVFYLTTPIYYPNDVPHIGHAYTTVAADFIARYRRLRGDEVFFLTGTDEHGKKIPQAAREHGMEPQAFVDAMEPKWREVWARLDISNDDYIRTTEPRHERAVIKLLEAVHDNGTDDIYKGTYEGAYCVACEAYYTEDELVDGNCPIHGTPVEHMTEENYFFRLSAYAGRLLAHYEGHPLAIQPEARRNEVLSLIRGGLRDFSISRTSFAWGVPLPWDPAHVCYVWFDALTNYLTAAGYENDPERFARTWPTDIHLIGKDIVRFHAIYWPAMLMAGGVELPTQVWAHGFLLVGGEKMSKTKLTGIHPFELIDQFGEDSYRYYFMREMRFGEDGSFSWESMVERHNADLANGLGNLASRVLAMLATYFDGVVPTPAFAGAESDLPSVIVDAARRYDEHMVAIQLQPALVAVWDIVARANQYLVEK
jgi:methionyl-tRNA synthetase